MRRAPDHFHTYSPICHKNHSWTYHFYYENITVNIILFPSTTYFLHPTPLTDTILTYCMQVIRCSWPPASVALHRITFIPTPNPSQDSSVNLPFPLYYPTLLSHPRRHLTSYIPPSLHQLQSSPIIYPSVNLLGARTLLLTLPPSTCYDTLRQNFLLNSTFHMNITIGANWYLQPPNILSLNDSQTSIQQKTCLNLS